MSEITFNVKQ